jgi:hypothetical protein
MYCRKCDRDDVSGFHKCFTPWGGNIRPLKKRPHPNTPLARRLAKLYEECYEEPFPGGITNAMIQRDQAAIRAYRDTGAWVWSLGVIDSNPGFCHDFGSGYPATKCVKDKYLIEISGTTDSHMSCFVEAFPDPD